MRAASRLLTVRMAVCIREGLSVVNFNHFTSNEPPVVFDLAALTSTALDR